MTPHSPSTQINKMKNVIVSGGTHGNEFTGAFLARHWLANASEICRPSFQTIPLFANPRAFEVCRRYVDRDLNRSFAPSGSLENPAAFELKLARQIEQDIFQKCDGKAPDVIFDLHTTTAEMGLSLVLTNRDPFNLLLYGYLRSRVANVRAYVWEEPSSRPGFLNSLARNGFAIEVGPIANGVLHAGRVLETSNLVGHCLDFIEMWNCSVLPSLPEKVPLYVFSRHIDYPRASDGLPSAMVHPEFQGRDFQELLPGQPIFLDFEGNAQCWNGEKTWPVFINEAAYYEKGIAFTATRREEVSLAELSALGSG
ncbi:aspartoacylase [bacterium]|nr:aspartoacylase [bacterium]